MHADTTVGRTVGGIGIYTGMEITGIENISKNLAHMYTYDPWLEIKSERRYFLVGKKVLFIYCPIFNSWENFKVNHTRPAISWYQEEEEEDRARCYSARTDESMAAAGKDTQTWDGVLTFHYHTIFKCFNIMPAKLENWYVVLQNVIEPAVHLFHFICTCQSIGSACKNAENKMQKKCFDRMG